MGIVASDTCSQKGKKRLLSLRFPADLLGNDGIFGAALATSSPPRERLLFLALPWHPVGGPRAPAAHVLW